MKVLLVHNFYQQPGGEDQCYQDTVNLLNSHGHTVIPFTAHNNDVAGMGRLKLAATTVWSRSAYGSLRKLVRREQPAVTHFMNTFPLISPAAYYAVRAEGSAVVQEVQNYRLACPGAYLMRDGKVCEKCLDRSIAWPGVMHGCYRGSRLASGAVAAMLGVHRAAGTWANAVDAYIAVTQFGRAKLIAAGLPADRVFVKPNMLDPDPGVGCGDGGYALFVGRLSPEKGVDSLLEAWRSIAADIPLKIAGDGPLAYRVRATAAEVAGITWLGRRGSDEVLELMRNARLLVFPSVWYEGLPKTIVESFACGTPVLASRLGAMEELVQQGRSGQWFMAGNAADLRSQALAMAGSPETGGSMRTAAREQFMQHFRPAASYRALMEIYSAALGLRHHHPLRRPSMAVSHTEMET